MSKRSATQLTFNPINFSVSSPFKADTDFTDLNRHFSERPLDELLQWSLDTFGDRVAQVTSFGPTGMVMLDHLARLNPGMRVVTLDTQFLFAETYALWDEVQRRYDIQLDVRRPSLTPEGQEKVYGGELWKKDPDRCCYIRKVLPLHVALQGLDAWLTGLRRDQSPTRAELPLVAWDDKYDLVKINPLAHWDRGQVWSYIVENKLPYNALHDRGYASIGCTHCTRPTHSQTNERAGRWQNRQKTECGIHIGSGYNKAQITLQ